MTRNELLALRDALDQVMAWPPAVLAEVARWLAPEATSKPGNGLDTSPAPGRVDGRRILAKSRRGAGRYFGSFRRCSVESAGKFEPPRRSLTPYAGKARRGKSMSARPDKVRQTAPFNTKAAEQRLLEALAEHSGSSVNALAKAAGAIDRAPASACDSSPRAGW